MTTFTHTWWGQRFMEVVGESIAKTRLAQGRSYARKRRILNCHLSKGRITAQVRGISNADSGVYNEPQYDVTIEMTPISQTDWSHVIKLLSSKASYIVKLLMSEMPDDIETVFSQLSLTLLPHQQVNTSCSCSQKVNPCEHIAGVYYQIASELDKDPFLLFEFRGLSKEELREELAGTPVGKALASHLLQEEIPLEPAKSYYTKPTKERIEETTDIKTFWTGKRRLPQHAEPPSAPATTALLIKKQGDFPSFWNNNNSFIEIMEEFYERVKEKNKKFLA